MLYVTHCVGRSKENSVQQILCCTFPSATQTVQHVNVALLITAFQTAPSAG